MPSSTILDATLVVRLDLADARLTNDEFAARLDAKAQLANVLLLYDSVAIPTYDLAIVPILVRWLGHGAYLNALIAGVFKFGRRRRLLGLCGGRKQHKHTGHFPQPSPPYSSRRAALAP